MAILDGEGPKEIKPEVKEIIKKDIKEEKKPSKKVEEKQVKKTDDLFFESKLGDKQQSHIMIGTYAPPMESDEQYAFHVMNSCLSGMGGRLFLELRDKKSLAYTVSSFYGPSQSMGHF